MKIFTSIEENDKLDRKRYGSITEECITQWEVLLLVNIEALKKMNNVVANPIILSHSKVCVLHVWIWTGINVIEVRFLEEKVRKGI